ncbi:MAG: hypothetical protein JWP58_1905 [Hymenobacter sp.]|nr:hypothetical protein [Hymenobacter sp.]
MVGLHYTARAMAAGTAKRSWPNDLCSKFSNLYPQSYRLTRKATCTTVGSSLLFNLIILLFTHFTPSFQ